MTAVAGNPEETARSGRFQRKAEQADMGTAPFSAPEASEASMRAARTAQEGGAPASATATETQTPEAVAAELAVNGHTKATAGLVMSG